MILEHRLLKLSLITKRDMPRLNDLPVGESVTMIVYGPVGSGKTHFCGTAGSRTLIINIGLGIVTLQSKGFKLRYPGVNPIIETIIEKSAIPDKAEAFDAVCLKLDEYLDPTHPEFNNIDTIIIDDITALRRSALLKGLEVNQSLNKSESLAKSKKYDTLVKAVQDYGQEMDFIEQFVSEYTGTCKRLGKHLILTAHERIQYNKASAIGAIATVNKIRPGFTGQTFPDQVTQYLDMIWYMETLGAGDRIKYFARTSGDAGLVAKTRWDGVFKTMEENPNFLDVVKRIRAV